MPRYRVEMDIHRYYTIDARNTDEAIYIAEAMYGEQHKGIIYDDQATEIDFEVYPLDEE